MKKLLFALLGSSLFMVACQQRPHQPVPNSMVVTFYNVENLFDTINNQGERDVEFTPESKKNWSQKRYDKKIEDLGKVLSATAGEKVPGLIGLCEVENRAVVEDLVRSSSLAPGGYKLIHEESPDYRGIDVALLYRPYFFKEVSHEVLTVTFPFDPDYTTRDILHAVLKGKKKDIIHVFVTHWPSRRGGTQESEPKRMHVASVIRQRVDELMADDANAKILIMGDFNDEPFNNSLQEGLLANGETPDSLSGKMHNLMYAKASAGLGTYNFRGSWNMLDNLVISSGMIHASSGWRALPSSGNIFHEPFMEYTTSNGDISPSRTYGGPNYYGGISDHFPVYFVLRR